MRESRFPSQTPSARCKRATRAEQARLGYRQRKFILSIDTIGLIDGIKESARLASRDLVVNRMVRKASVLYDPQDCEARNTRRSDVVRSAVIITIDRDNAAYLDKVAAHYAPCTLGDALDAVLRRARDLSPAPAQLSLQPLLSQEIAVSG